MSGQEAVNTSLQRAVSGVAGAAQVRQFVVQLRAAAELRLYI